MDAALAMLSRRALSEAEVRERLAGKGFPGAEVAAVGVRLKELGLLNDRDLALRLARSYREARRYGPARIAWALRNRLFPAALVAEAVRSACPPGEEVAAAADALRRKWKNGAPRDRKEAARAYRFLAGRGFSPEACRRAIRGLRFDIPEGGDESDR
ncbi:MAG: recombination regulator RecX [Deltaproteobacteria bacterium]|nr:recombination regulator RecX [Deltaproteobacteria bacterium]